jgi:hypothetical protein
LIDEADEAVETDTLPPPMSDESQAIATAIISAMRKMIQPIVAQEVGKVAALAGTSQKQISDKVDEALGKMVERDEQMMNHLVAVHAACRQVADFVGLPEEGSIAHL